MRATLTEWDPRAPFTGPGWLYERKLDGFRALAFRDGPRVRLLSRNRNDLGPIFPEIVEAVRLQPVESLVLDGEVVAMRGESGTFSRLQQRLRPTTLAAALRGAVKLRYIIFDLLFAQGHDLRALPLVERKRLLTKAVALTDPLEFCEHREGDARAFFERACRDGWEGIIAKRVDSPYVGRRGRLWLKLKCGRGQEFIIGGYTDPKGSRAGFGALLLGYNERGRLRYAGRVGTGFSDALLERLHRALKELRRTEPPFAPSPDLPRKGIHWVRPRLVAEVRFSEWTGDDRLRHPVFLGLRPDKEPRTVVRERPVPSGDDRRDRRKRRA